MNRVATASANGAAATGTSTPLAVRLHRIRLESRTPLRSARETITDRQVILVEVVDATGRVGWGECPALAKPGYSAEYLDGAWAVLRDVLVPLVVHDPAGAIGLVAKVPGHQMARNGIVGALIDLQLRAEGRSLGEALAHGESRSDRVASNAVIGIQDSPADLEAAVERALEAGHRSVKLKIDPAHDVVPVTTVRSQWPDLALAVDANGSYEDADAAVRALASVEKAAGTLSYVEQPVGADDLVGAAVIARRLDSPLALDESISTVGEVVTAVSLGALGALNVKPARVGGPIEAVAVARIAASEGVAVFCGGMVESGIGRAAALAFASQSMCTLPCDLGPSERYHLRDVTEPFELVDGDLKVPDGPGIGVAPLADVLAEQMVDSWSSS